MFSWTYMLPFAVILMGNFDGIPANRSSQILQIEAEQLPG